MSEELRNSLSKEVHFFFIEIFLIVYKERQTLFKLYLFPLKSLVEIQRLDISSDGRRLTESFF